MNNQTTNPFNKVPAVTIAFWIIKVLSTTVGETGADFLAVNIGWGLGITIGFAHNSMVGLSALKPTNQIPIHSGGHLHIMQIMRRESAYSRELALPACGLGTGRTVAHNFCIMLTP